MWTSIHIWAKNAGTKSDPTASYLYESRGRDCVMRSTYVYLCTAIVVCAVILELPGCSSPGNDSSAAPRPSTCASSPASGSPALGNDRTLEVAADSTEPYLRASFPNTFAGLRLDHRAETMTIYRHPDPSLDSAVRSRVHGVVVTFCDARYSLAQMQKLVDGILRDREYWASNGIEINGVGPTVDGSAVLVMTSRGEQDEPAMTRHYQARIVVQKEKPVLVPPGLRFTPPSQLGIPKSTTRTVHGP